MTPSPSVPARLVRAHRRGEDDVLRTRLFRLSGTSINGQDFDSARIDEVVRAGATEIWEVENGSGTPHNFHPHGVSFRVLGQGGHPPPPALAGWKDTVYVRPGPTLRLLVRFGDYVDANTPYMFHCHLLQHEDRGMMGQFVLVGPGERPRDPSRPHGHDSG